jgi:shikimate dehydrogenase
MDNERKKFAIFGDPVKHSKSPEMHNNAFNHIKYNAIYEKELLKDGTQLRDVFLQKGYSGANITVPHKEEAFKQADVIVGLAQRVKAVNTYVKKGSDIYAYNTDGPGFLAAIKDFCDVNHALIIGAGGTAKAIATALIEDGKQATVLNRSKTKLDYFDSLGCNTFSWDNFEITSPFDLVVNATSAGLKDDYFPISQDVLEEIFQNSEYAFDCIYGKTTPFIQLAKKRNLIVKDGEDMLLYQGVLAFELFTNTTANQSVIACMKSALKIKA